MKEVATLDILSSELRAIADAVDHLEQVKAKVNDAFVGRHRVTLEWHDDQRDGTYYKIIGIERTGR